MPTVGSEERVIAAYPRMVAQGHGHIVNVASMAGLAPTPPTAAFGAPIAVLGRFVAPVAR